MVNLSNIRTIFTKTYSINFHQFVYWTSQRKMPKLLDLIADKVLIDFVTWICCFDADTKEVVQANNMAKLDINLLVKQVLSSNETNSFASLTENLKLYLSNWQLSQLEKVKESESGVRCLLNSWIVTQKGLQKGSFCNATWDNVYCWPPTPLATIVNRTCLEAFKETEPLYAPHLKGHGYRVCQANGSWLWNSWTNYTECADSFEAFVNRTVTHVGESELVTSVQYIFFIGSILSLLFMLSAIITFCKFRSLWCDRVTIHIHLMTSLMLRYIMLLIITEPYIFKRSTYYRNDDGVCKGVLIVYLYATLSSINWMFIQGIYINGKLTTNVFGDRAPLRVYYTIGWLFPLVLMTIWTIIMSFNQDVYCWSGYAAMNEIWIIIGPMVVALVMNFIFLINILRVLLFKVRTPGPNTDAAQFRRAAKATLLLCPLLGINNLLVLYNPGGTLKKYFVIINTLISSAQGIFVAVGYCFLNKDIRAAFQRVYHRFLVRRNANNIRLHENSLNRSNANCGASLHLILEQPVNSVNTNLRTTPAFKTSPSASINLNECNSSMGNNSYTSTHRANQASSCNLEETSC